MNTLGQTPLQSLALAAAELNLDVRLHRDRDFDNGRAAIRKGVYMGITVDSAIFPPILVQARLLTPCGRR